MTNINEQIARVVDSWRRDKEISIWLDPDDMQLLAQRAIGVLSETDLPEVTNPREAARRLGFVVDASVQAYREALTVLDREADPNEEQEDAINGIYRVLRLADDLKREMGTASRPLNRLEMTLRAEYR